MRAMTLKPTDAPSGHAFAHPDHIVADRATLEMLFTDFLRHLSACATEDQVVVRHVPDSDSWFRRVLIPRPVAATQREEFTVVGFFGRRRLIVAPEVNQLIADLSSALDEILPTIPGLLAYTTHLLVDELNYANLVVLDSPETISIWRDTAPHPEAAEAVSPAFYDHVRIYRGAVRFGMSNPVLDLERVKYWDFRQTPTWHAVRVLRPT